MKKTFSKSRARLKTWGLAASAVRPKPPVPEESSNGLISPLPVSFLAPAHEARMLRRVDELAVVYLGGTSVLFVPGCAVRWVYPLCIGLHVAAAASLIALARARSLPPVLRAVRDLYPMLLLMVLYGEVDLIVQLLHEPPGFDALVRQWDLWLFGFHPHQHFHQWLSGPGWQEFFHLLYLSYYLLVVGAFLAVWKNQPATLPRFAFVITGMFVSFIVIFVAVPVAGPLSRPGVSLTTTGVFPGIVAQIYAPLTMNGIHTGAFPSSHVGMSVGLVLGLAPRRGWVRIALGGLVLGIAASTVYGQFHYAIDTVAGLGAGGLLYVGWARLYTVLESRPAPVTEAEANEPALMLPPPSSGG